MLVRWKKYLTNKTAFYKSTHLFCVKKYGWLFVVCILTKLTSLQRWLDKKDLFPFTIKSAIFSSKISLTVYSIVQIVVLLLKHFFGARLWRKSRHLGSWYFSSKSKKTESWKSFWEKCWIFLHNLSAKKDLMWGNHNDIEHQHLPSNFFCPLTSKLSLACGLISWKVSVEPGLAQSPHASQRLQSVNLVLDNNNINYANKRKEKTLAPIERKILVLYNKDCYTVNHKIVAKIFYQPCCL